MEFFVAEMTRAVMFNISIQFSLCYCSNCTQDIKRIGVKPEGFVRHLEKCIKKLVATPINSGIPVSYAQLSHNAIHCHFTRNQLRVG